MHMSKWDMRSLVLSMHDIQRQASATISQIIDEVIPFDHQLVTKLGDTLWDCKSSPFLFCAYNVVEDPAKDLCIFCGEPEERK